MDIATSTCSGLAPEPRVQVTAMAGIVRDLVVGGRARLRDSMWLRRRVAAAGLSPQEGTALEELRARLRAGGVASLETASFQWI